MADVMEVVSDAERALRQAEFKAQKAAEEAAETEARRNRGFIQVYSKGWLRIRSLLERQPRAARLYALLAENLSSGGALVASQAVLAAQLGVTDRTIRNLSDLLESEGAIIRIRVGSGVYAYALDPAEVWNSWDTAKDFAVFNTRTLVNKSEGENRYVDRKIRLMLGQHQQELPLDRTE